MRIRLAMIAIAAAATGSVAIAQPRKDEQPAKSPKPAVAAPVILASASDVGRAARAETERPAGPARRPAPRVTTCRCGDPQPDSNQQQPDE